VSVKLKSENEPTPSYVLVLLNPLKTTMSGKGDFQISNVFRGLRTSLSSQQEVTPDGEGEQ
jgi:hypothetical protein